MKNMTLMLQQYQEQLDILAIAFDGNDQDGVAEAEAAIERLARRLAEERPTVCSYSHDGYDKGRYVVGTLKSLNGDSASIVEDSGAETLCVVDKLELAGCLV